MSSRNGRTRLGLALRRLRFRLARATEPVLGPFRARWQRSLRLRTMTVTAVVTGVMILISGTFILTSVRDDLYSSRRDQVLEDSARATVAAQSQIDASSANDRGTLLALSASVRRTVQDTSASQFIYMRRQPGQEFFPDAPDDFTYSTQLIDAVTPELEAAVRSGEAPQHWQPVTLRDENGRDGPGILVASSLTFPSGAGEYDLFIGYSLADTERTLGFITRTLGLTALFLMLLIGGLVLAISNIVFRPIRSAADASRRLAGGESNARMPLQKDEHFDELSENFNDMADTLQARIAELDHLSEMQQRFVSDVSHELRTPLTTIRLASEVLRGQEQQATADGGTDADSADTPAPPARGFDATQARALEVLSTQVERFERLLTDLLEISRYDAGSVSIEVEPTNLVALTNEVVDSLRPLSESPIEVNAVGGFTPVEVDARRIRRIVSNLVGNAIEHGEGHPIEVTIDSNADAVAIGVRDRGVGLSTEHLSHVFDRFWRADPSRKRTLGGTGLGLAIAQEDAAVHGGVLEAWSSLGEGSHFRLTLPRSRRDPSYVSPLPLVPDDAPDIAKDDDHTVGWLRWATKRRSKDSRGSKERKR